MKAFIREWWVMGILCVLFSASVGGLVNAIEKQQERNYAAYTQPSVTIEVKP